jgi:hypothetical protein
VDHAAANTSPFRYRRHEPEKTLLYQVLAREWDSWLAERQADTDRSPLPAYVEREFEAFLRCGLLQHDFLILSCEGCGEKLPVAFSCKKRGFCPSCCAKRMSETAVHLIDNVLPRTAYRQWVVTFPHSLRYWMAASRKLTSLIHKLVSERITHYYVHAAEERGIKAPQAGGVTFVQRFGSALNANVHFHTVAFDGVFSVGGPMPIFHQLRGPTDEEVADIVATLAQDVIVALRERGYLAKDGEETLAATWLDKCFAESEQLAAATEASARQRIAFGTRAGQKVRRVGRGFGTDDELPLVRGRRCYAVNGFSLHANRYIGPQERRKLEELLAYGARGSFANHRLSLVDAADPEGDLRYQLKTPWSDGTEAIRLSSAEIIEKLVALVPPPYIHQTRYFGVLSSHSRWRRQIVLRPEVKKGFVAGENGAGPQRMTWARLLARVFKIDVTRCRACGAPLRPEHCEIVTEAPLVAGILVALGHSPHPPARAPPRRRAELDLDIDQRLPYLDDDT